MHPRSSSTPMATDQRIERTSSDSNQPSPLLKYITRNSVYYVLGDVCMEVREGRDERIVAGHGAIEQRVVACVRWKRDGGHDVLIGQFPRVGDSLLLGESMEHQVLTSAVRRIESPSA